MPLHHHPQETCVLFRKIICICHLLLLEHLFVCLWIWKISVKTFILCYYHIWIGFYKIIVDKCLKLYTCSMMISKLECILYFFEMAKKLLLHVFGETAILQMSHLCLVIESFSSIPYTTSVAYLFVSSFYLSGHLEWIDFLA